MNINSDAVDEFDVPPAASPVPLHLGRYPGSQVLIYRLPMITHSGLLETHTR